MTDVPRGRRGASASSLAKLRRRPRSPVSLRSRRLDRGVGCSRAAVARDPRATTSQLDGQVARGGRPARCSRSLSRRLSASAVGAIVQNQVGAIVDCVRLDPGRRIARHACLLGARVHRHRRADPISPYLPGSALPTASSAARATSSCSRRLRPRCWPSPTWSGCSVAGGALRSRRRDIRSYAHAGGRAGSQGTRSSSSTVDSLAYGGNGVARLNGFVVFVRRGLPGDRVRARVTKVKRGFAEALATEVLEPAPQRVEAPCAHYPACGGCRFQDLAYDAQARGEGRAGAATRSRGSAGSPSRRSSRSSPAESPFFYRNKLEYSFTQTPAGPTLGFHRPAAGTRCSRSSSAG